MAARHGGLPGIAALAAVLALGLGLRLAEAWDGRAPVYDARAYAAIAANLERGEGFTAGPGATQPSSNYSPGLPLLVAGLYAIAGGPDERAARLVLALLGALAVPLAYLIALRLGRAAAGARGDEEPDRATVAGALAAAAAVAAYPALVEYQGMLMSEPLAATLLAGAVLAVLRAADRSPRSDAARQGDPVRGARPGEGGLRAGRFVRSRPPFPGHPLVGWVLPGVLFGALAMVRPEYLGIAGLVALVVAVREARGNWKGGVAQGAVFLVGVAVVVTPWMVRNAVVLDRVGTLSTGGGQVLFAGTYVPSGGDPERVGREVVAENPGLFAPGDAERLRLEQILARLAADRHPGVETDRALARMGREQLLDELGRRPLAYAGFVAAKVGRVWSHGPRAVMREPGWEALHWALLALGLLGLGVLAWRRRWEALLLGVVFAAVTVLGALLVASPRRALVTLPLLSALAGVGAARCAQELRRRRPAAAPRRDSLGRP